LNLVTGGADFRGANFELHRAAGSRQPAADGDKPPRAGHLERLANLAGQDRDLNAAACAVVVGAPGQSCRYGPAQCLGDVPAP